MKDKKYLVATDAGGLANRLKCLISVWRLADLYQRNFLLCWYKKKDCGADFSDLFENNLPRISKEELKRIKNKEIKFYFGNLGEIPNSKHKYITSDTASLISLPSEVPDNFSRECPTEKGNNLDLEFERIPENVRKKVLNYLKKLKPEKNLGKIANEFSRKHNIKSRIGIHVRRGDFLNMKENLGDISSDEKFFIRIREILKENPKTKFLLCTDSEETEKNFLNEFGKKIIFYPKKNRNRASKKAVQESLIDLLLLSHTKQILGTYLSTFTEMAWWFGNCKAKVEIVVSEKEKRKIKGDTKKDKRNLFKKIKRIIYLIITPPKKRF